MKKVYQSHLFFSFFNKTFIVAIFLMLSGGVGFAQAPYSWTGLTNTDWTVSTNWAPVRLTPLSTDVLTFNNGITNTIINVPTQSIGQLIVAPLVATPTIVNLQAGTAGDVLTIEGWAGSGITVNAGCELNINGVNSLLINIKSSALSIVTGNVSLSNGPHRLDGEQAGVLSFNSPAIFTQGAGCTGYAFNAALGGGSLNAVDFNNGSVFVQLDGSNPFGTSAGPNAKVVFHTGSLFKLQQNVAPSFFGRVYANVEINNIGFNQTLTDALSEGAMTVDNLTITQGVLTINSAPSGLNIKGNISVAASQSLTFNSNNLRLNGTASPQTIVNNGTLNFGAGETVIFNNPMGFNLNSDITLDGAVTFTNGVVTVPGTNVLTFSSTASVAGVLTSASYVDGRVRKIGNTDFVFPVGKLSIHGHAPIGISNFFGGSATSAFIAEYIRSSAQALGPVSVGIDHVSRADYWTLNNTGTGTPTVNVSLYWTSSSSFGGSPNYINSLVDLVVAYFDGTNWSNFGGLSTASGSFTAGSVTWSSVPAYNRFALGSSTIFNPLPITVNYINGTKQNGTHLLNWQVSCVNNLSAKMIVERSADNKNFTAVTTVTATALRCQQPFDYTDAAPLPGINYYRLKTINDDGKVSYSTTIVLLNKQSGFDMVSLLPNVVTANAVLNIAAVQKTKLNIVITDIAGRQVQQASYILVAGSNQFEINVASLAAGTYQITGYTAEGVTKTLRFVKQ